MTCLQQSATKRWFNISGFMPLFIGKSAWLLMHVFFRPFQNVKILSMAKAFDMSVELLEESLVRLIADKRLSARIDSHNKVLYATIADSRNVTFQKVFLYVNAFNFTMLMFDL